MENERNIQIKLDTEAPVTEPQRQFFFMEQAKALVAEREAALGRKLTFHVETFGCQVNTEHEISKAA